MTDFSAGPLTRDLWQQAHPTIAKIEALPFLRELVDGSLDPLVFTFYIMQDDQYLIGFARTMALLSAKAHDVGQSRFWAESVTTAIAAEEQMHRALLEDDYLAASRRALIDPARHFRPSPTTLGYVSYLEAGAALKSYEVGVAGVLPCFWVYAHVGKLLAERGKRLGANHPYKAWIDAYDCKEFDEATRAAVRILEQCLDETTDAERETMREVFLQACTYEWHFWHAAHIMQDWSLPSMSEAAAA